MSQPVSVGERALSWPDYLALPDELRAEYVDGRVVVNPPASYVHQKICHRLVTAFGAVLSAPCDVVSAAGWQVGPQHVRVPDVMIVDQAPEGPLVTRTPWVCVEVLSTNRSDDLVRTSTEYLEADVAQY